MLIHVGNESSSHDGNPLNSVRVRFDKSDVGYLSYDSWRSLSDSVLSNIFDIRRTTGGENVSILNDNLAYSLVMDGSYFTFSPLENLSSGSYSVVVKNYAVRSDAGKILDSSNKSDYFNNANVSFNFTVSTPCTRGEPGYFQLTGGTNDASNCIQLVDPPTVSYLDSEGNVVTNTNEISDHSIRITFEEPVGFIDATEHGNLTSENVVKMVDVKLGNIDLLDVGFGFTIEVSSDESSFILTPETNTSGVSTYPAGSYTVGVSSYAKKFDISKVATSTNRAEYLSMVNSMSQSLSSFSVHTPCSRGESGYFELTNSNGTTECIELPEVSFTFTPSGGSESSTHDGDPTTVIKIKVDSQIMYLGSGNTSSNLSNQNILDMLKVKDSNGVDLAAVDGSIGTDQISFTSSAGSTVITVSPPDGLVYTPGSYTVSFSDFAKSVDASKVVASSNKPSYLNAVSQQIFTFTVVRIETPCTRGEAGYFELSNSDGTTECIELPEVSFTFTPNGGSKSSSHDGDPTTVINIKVDSEIMYLGSGNTFINLSNQNILDMLKVKDSNGVDLAAVDGSIGTDQISFTSSAGSTVITVSPPDGLVYTPGSYTVSFSDFAKSVDASKVVASSNKFSYLNAVSQQISFTVVRIETPCD